MIYKAKSTLALVTLGLVSLSSCGKDFLDREPSEIFSPEQIQRAATWNDNVGPGYLNSIISAFYDPNQTQNDQHNDFAQKAQDINTDLLSGDMEMPTTSRGWFKDAASLLISPATSATNYQMWTFNYRAIRAANSFFQSLGSDVELSASIQGANRHAWGQAKVLRAAALLNLCHLYGKPYSGLP